MDVIQIGNRIKQARIRNSRTLDDIAAGIGVAKSTVQRYENGLIKRPKLPVLQAIAGYLDVNYAWLSGKDAPMDQEKSGLPYYETEMLHSFSQLAVSNKKKAIQYTQNLLMLQQMEEEAEFMPKAAHARTDIEVTDEMKRHDDELMADNEIWK